jgi:CrcB protein
MTARDDHELPIDADLDPADPAAPARERRPVRRVRRADPAVLAAIALGGVIGAPARYGVAQVVHVAPNSFPWATFVTNVSGSFAIGLLLVFILECLPPTKKTTPSLQCASGATAAASARYVRPFVATGVLGAYTTYSTFAVETDLLVKNGHADIAFLYVASSFIVGFAAVWVGIAIARLVPRRAGVRR